MIKVTEEMIELAGKAGRIEIEPPEPGSDVWFIVTPKTAKQPRIAIAAGGEADIRLLAARLAILIKGLKLTNADQFGGSKSAQDQPKKARKPLSRKAPLKTKAPLRRKTPLRSRKPDPTDAQKDESDD